ncbi:MAG: 16S rRNA (cytosine(967)-C(5))-methyltransferase RsmB [Anaerovoracaceae bacterium]
MDNDRITAYDALLAVEADKAYSNIALNNAVKKLHPKDEAFVRAVVYGVIENRLYLEYRLAQLLNTGFKKVDVRIKVILLMGAYQIEFMESVPSYAAINESVELTKKIKRGLHGFVNGVLRSYDRNLSRLELPDRDSMPMDYLSVKYSYNIDIVKMWVEMFGEERAEKLLAAGNTVPPLTIRTNTLKISTAELAAVLTDAGFEVAPADPVIAVGISQETATRAASLMLKVKGSGLIDSELFKEGLFSVQDSASVAAVCTLQPAPGDVLLDLCAAPGGKSMCAAALMMNEGRIISCDVHEHKLRLMEQEAKRLGVEIAELRLNDATFSDGGFIGIADKVIADVPCSGLGTVRRRPEIKLHMNKKKIEALAKKQLKILENAADCVKEKGMLFYSTCTISKIENQAVSAMFLKKNKKFFKVAEVQLITKISSSDGFYFSVFQRF